ncbi:MAG: UvrD-helicase domain-containing protein [Methylococcus sp.]
MARLMMSRDVLKDFGGLPVKVQRKVFEFVRKFQDDSTQASLHLEPCLGALDSKVRSARIGDDYRAIVIAPEKGDNFLLMYVDHHDEAYRWCRNKRFEAHQALGVLQVFDVQAIETVAKAQVTCPVESPEYPLDRLSDEDLFQAGVPRALIPAVRAIRGDEAFQEFAEYLPREASQVLYGIVCGLSLDEALREMLGEPGSTSFKPVGPGDFSHLDQAMNMDLVLVEGEEHLKSILSQDLEAWRIFLHPYQRKLVEWKTQGPMKIHGAAGTGKTVALMHRAVHLARQVQSDKDRILVTTYTTNLSITLEQLLRTLSPEIAPRIEVTNLHQLARTICIRGGWQGKVLEDPDREDIWRRILTDPLPPGFDPDFVKEEHRDVVDKMGIDNEDAYMTVVRSGRPRLDRKQRKALWPVFVEFNRLLHKRNLLTFEGLVHQARLVVERGLFPKYRHVLVDELQDFGLEALRLIAAISDLSSGRTDPLCLVGDGHQRIYNPTPIPLSRAGIDVRGRSRRLKVNYRTSEQIRRWAHGLLKGMVIDDLDGGLAVTVGDQSMFRGPEPVIHRSENIQPLAGQAVDWVRWLMSERGLGSHEICVTPNVQWLRTALESAGIGTYELKPRQADPGQLEPGVRFGTMQRIKGLEFRAIVMVLEPESLAEASPRQRFERYVAATRAREFLMVLSLG